MTRRFEKRKPNDIVRFCRCCGTNNNKFPFLVQKNYKNGKFYKHSICKPCYEEETSINRIAYYNKNREKQIADAKKWNVDNRDRYNRRRRKTFLEKWCGE